MKEIDVRKRKGYKKSKLGWIPESWKLMSIDEITERVTNRVAVDPVKDYQEIGIRSHGKGIFHKEKVQGKTLGNKRVFWIESGCFTVNIVFAWEQAVAKTTDKEVGMIASHRFPMYKPKKEVLNLDFLLHFFKTPLGKHLLGLASPGGAGRNKTLGQKQFGKLLIPLPPYKDQLNISKIIEVWDSGISCMEQLILEKNKFKIGIMQKLIPDQTIENQTTKSTLGNIAKIKTGKKDNQDKIENGDYPFFVRSKNVERINSFSFDGEAILIPGEGKIGEIFHYIKGKFDYHQRVYKVSDFSDTYHGKFIYYYFQRHFKKEAIRNSVKATVDSLRLPTFQEMSIFAPQKTVQIKIANTLECIDKELEAYRVKLEYLHNQHKGLKQNLLTGKIQTI